MGGITSASMHNHLNRKGSELTCYCGKTFYCSPAQLKYRKYCSKECKAKLERNKVEVVCKICGKTFTTSHNSKKAVYCSAICSGKAARERKYEERKEKYESYLKEFKQ